MLKRGENIPGCLFTLQWEVAMNCYYLASSKNKRGSGK